MFEPYLAIVVDPKRTMSAGKVEIGCFRTYTDDYAKKVKAESEK
jgi:COP9 signalosome complex subunit 5